MKNLKKYFKYIFSLLLFGSNGIVASHINLTSYEIVFWRTLIGSIFLILIFALTKQRITFYHYKKDFVFIILSGIAMGTSWLFLYEAYAQIGVSLASLAYYCGPVIVMILSPFIFKEKMTGAKVVGFTIVLIGVILVNGKLSGNMNKYGIFLGLMSAVMYSLMVILNKKSVKIKGVENVVIQLLCSFITVAIFTIFKTGLHFYIEKCDFLWIILLGILNTGIGCYLYFSSIGKLPVQSVAICGYIEPLSAVILAVILLDENMTIIQYIGAICIVSGAMFGECWKIRE